MIRVSAKVAGGKKGSVKLKRFTSGLRHNLIRGVDQATTILEREIKEQLSRGGGFRKRKGRPWIPNPGKHLRVGDGTLRASWKRTPARRVRGGVEGHVATDLPYAAIHEFGGLAGKGGMVNIPERPYVRPSLDKRRDQMTNAIGKAITRPLR